MSSSDVEGGCVFRQERGGGWCFVFPRRGASFSLGPRGSGDCWVGNRKRELLCPGSLVVGARPGRETQSCTSLPGGKMKKVFFLTLFVFLLPILAQYASKYPILVLQVLFANVYAAFLPFSRVLSTKRKEGWNGAEGRKGKRGRERCPRLWRRVRRSVGRSAEGERTGGARLGRCNPL